MQALVDLEATDRRWQAAESRAIELANVHEATRGELASVIRQLEEAELRARTIDAERRAVIDAAERRISRLQVEASAEMRRLGALEAVQAQLRVELQSAREQARFLEARIRGFEGSTSWRLTRPLRWIGRLVRWLSPFVRWHRHRLELAPCAPVEMGDAAIGHTEWYEASSSRGSLPTRWVALRFIGAPREGTASVTLFVDPGGSRWESMPLPAIRGKADTYLVRLPETATALRVSVWTSRQAKSERPRLAARELGQIEVGLRLLWRNRRRLPGAIRHLKRFGLAKTLERARGIRQQQVVDHYPAWIQAYDTLSDTDRAAIRAHIGELKTRPLISVVVPVYNTPERYLREMLDSVARQLYPHWELCIADDASTESHVRAVLQEYAARDDRIKLTFRETNGHISAASNSALDLASGAYVALLDHDDVLAEHALYLVVVAINEHPDADLFYSDEDKINDQGQRFGPYFKPDFGLELLLGQNYISHLGVYRLDTIKAIGGFRVGFEGSQDYDLMLRVIDQSMKPAIHIPWILYHWRIFLGAGTFSSNHINKASDSARKAILDHMSRRAIRGSIKPWVYAWHIVVRDDPARWPKVSVVVPTRDRLDVLKICLDDVLGRTDYPEIELIVANNDSREPQTLAYFETLRADARVHILDVPGPFNYSAVNNAAVRASSGEIILLLNNDIEVIDGRWLKEMVRHAIRPEVGAVGAKLLYPDNTIQHGGVILGLSGVAAHLHVTEPASSPGYYGWLRLARDVSATTAACLALRRSVFEEVGGFDEVNLKVAFNDIDLCLKITEKGYRIIWTPEATLYHWESESRGHDTSSKQLARFKEEADYMRGRWGRRLERDPFFNPNLSLESTHPIVAFPPRVERPWRGHLGSSAEAS
jgi:O-antigen biosynthesis protein